MFELLDPNVDTAGSSALRICLFSSRQDQWGFVDTQICCWLTLADCRSAPPPLLSCAFLHAKRNSVFNPPLGERYLGIAQRKNALLAHCQRIMPVVHPQSVEDDYRLTEFVCMTNAQ